jgi:hypothetical protein
MSFDWHTDPAMQHLAHIQARAEQNQQPAPPPPPEIHLTITLPPIDVHVSNDVQPAPVHVETRGAQVHVPQAAPPSVKVNVPATPTAKEITIERDEHGLIVGAHVKEKPAGG